MKHPVRTLLRVFYVAVAPLLILIFGMSAAVLIGIAIGFAGSEATDTWQVLRIVEVPASARDRVVGGFLAVNIFSVLIFVIYLRDLWRALRIHKLGLIEFALKPLKDRRYMLESTRRKPRGA